MLSNLPKVKQLANGQVKIRTQIHLNFKLAPVRLLGIYGTERSSLISCQMLATECAFLSGC